MDYTDPDVNEEEAKTVWDSLLSDPSASDKEFFGAIKKGRYKFPYKVIHHGMSNLEIWKQEGKPRCFKSGNCRLWI